MVRSALRASNHQAAYRFARCGLRADLPDSGQITVYSHLQKYIPSRFAQIKTINPAVSSHQEGRLAIVTNAGRDAVDADVLWTNSTKADGEVVWSWRLDAGVKFAGRNSADDGDNKARSPGRARRKPLKPLRREGRVTPVSLW